MSQTIVEFFIQKLKLNLFPLKRWIDFVPLFLPVWRFARRDGSLRIQFWKFFCESCQHFWSFFSLHSCFNNRLIFSEILQLFFPFFLEQNESTSTTGWIFQNPGILVESSPKNVLETNLGNLDWNQITNLVEFTG